MHRQIYKGNLSNNKCSAITVEELTWAASGLGKEMKQDLPTLRQLLRAHGSRVYIKELLDQTDADGCTPLMSAAQNDQVKNMKALVKAGASVNAAATTTNLTALMQAAACGRVDAVNWLLDNGAEVDQRDAHGWTALDHAHISESNATRANVDDYIIPCERLLAAQMIRK
jgi:ankyrin repeat protein